MKKKEWQALVDHICRNSVAPHLERILTHHLDLRHKDPVRRLIRAMKTIRYIQSEVSDHEKLTDVFSQDHLDRLLHDLIYGLGVIERWIVDTGIADEIQRFHNEIVERMDVDDFPEIDVQLLRDLGFDTPELELTLMIRQSKKIDARLSASNSNDSWDLNFSRSVTNSIEILKCRAEQSKKEDEDKPKPKTKWLKGLGSICKGTAFTIVDSTLLGGMWTGIVPPHMASVGAIVSITTGLGDILSGAGDLRGE